MLGFDFDMVISNMAIKFWYRQITIPENLAGMILELAAGAVLHPNQALGQQTKAYIRTSHHCIRVRQGVKLDMELGERHVILVSVFGDEIGEEQKAGVIATVLSTARLAKHFFSVKVKHGDC